MSRKNLQWLAVSIFFLEFLGIVWLWLGQPPQWFRLNFYSLSWWPFLIWVETLAQLRWGRSLLYDRPMDFVRLCILSIPFWTFYEILNVRLQNWIYAGELPPDGIQWLGYALAYASVLPAIRVYLDLLRPHDEVKHYEFNDQPLLVGVCIALGLAQVFLLMGWPIIFYPLAWSFSFFFTEPLVVEREPDRSYLIQWSQGRWRLTLHTVMAGLLAGGTWEFLNWKAGAKWIYTLPPDMVLFKIFEMPVLGFIGFGAFALCAESFSNLCLAPHTRKILWRASIVASGVMALFGFAMIDAFTWIN